MNKYITMPRIISTRNVSNVLLPCTKKCGYDCVERVVAVNKQGYMIKDCEFVVTGRTGHGELLIDINLVDGADGYCIKYNRLLEDNVDAILLTESQEVCID